MDSSEVVEVPIESAQEYIATALKFAPLNLSDKCEAVIKFISSVYNIFIDNLSTLVDSVVTKIYSKYEECISSSSLDGLNKMLKLKLQAQMNVLFDQFDTFLLTNVFGIDDNAVLPQDMPQTVCSKRKYDQIKSSVEKHENQIFSLKSAEARVNQELISIKTLQGDLNNASSVIEKTVESLFGKISVADVCHFVEELKIAESRSEIP
ncbi:hypothetical protein Aperf_G00000111333 [Anoplocephala perfoliata]